MPCVPPHARSRPLNPLPPPPPTLPRCPRGLQASDSGALPTFDFDGDPPPEDTDEPQLSDGLAVAALETDWDPTDGDYIRALARKGVGPAVVGGLCVIGLLCILLVRCLCGPVGQVRCRCRRARCALCVCYGGGPVESAQRGSACRATRTGRSCAARG